MNRNLASETCGGWDRQKDLNMIQDLLPAVPPDMQRTVALSPSVAWCPALVETEMKQREVASRGVSHLNEVENCYSQNCEPWNAKGIGKIVNGVSKAFTSFS